MLFGGLLKYNGRLYPDKLTVKLSDIIFTVWDFDPVLKISNSSNVNKAGLKTSQIEPDPLTFNRVLTSTKPE